MIVFTVMVGVLQPALVVYAAPPAILGYQGRLLDSSGNLETGTFCLKFSIYTAASGGSKLWPSGAPSAQEVEVTSGVFNAGIGDTVAGGDALDITFLDTNNYYLNVEVAEQVGGVCTGGDETFETVTPRQQLLASAFAQSAQYLNSSATEDTERARFADTTNADSVSIYVGKGSPNGSLSAQTGSVFLDQDGGFYLNTSGGGSGTTWSNIASGGSSSALSAITDALGDSTLSNGANNITWNWQLTGAESALSIGESTASTGGSSNQYLLDVSTLATSTAIPLYVQNLGSGRSFQVDDSAGDTTPFVIDAAGNVGIGDPSPTSLLSVGDGDLFQVNSSGAIAAATGITSSGTITFSGLANGFVKANGSGVLSGGNSINLASDITGTLPIANGGTGATSLTNLIALSTHTTGNYVTSVTNGTGITGGNGGSEGAALTLAFDYTSTLAGNPTLNAGETVFGTTGLIFEGSTANTFETLLTITDATADNTITLPDASGTVILSGHTFTGDVTGTLDTDGSTALTIAADSIALATDTTGNYVATITGNSQISVSGSGSENAAVSLSIAADSIGDSQLAFNTGQHLTTSSDVTFANTTLATGGALRSATSSGNTLLLQAYDVDGAAYITFGTLTAGNTPTFDLSASTTIGGNAFYYAGGTDIAVADGGTGAGSFTDGGILFGNGTSAIGATAVLSNGQLLIGDGSEEPTVATLTGTSNQVVVTNGAGSITLSLPQSIAASSSPTFAGLTLSNGETIVNTTDGRITFATNTANADTLNLTPAGGGADTFAGIITSADLTGARTWTFPNVSGTVVTTGDTGTVTNTMLAGSIAASKLVGTDIDTVGTITSGVWNAGAITSSGALDVATTIQAGSSNITLTTSAGYVDADALQLISGDGAGSTSSGSGLETDTDRLGLLQGCSDNQILKWDEAGSVWACDSDLSGGGGSTLQGAYDAGSTITTGDNSDLTVTLANTTTDSDFAIVIATGSTGTASITRADGSGAADPPQLLLLDNADTDRAQPIGLLISSAAGGLTTAIDVSDADIGTALSIGANTLAVTTGTIGSNGAAVIDFAEFDVSGSTGSITIDDNGDAGSITIDGTALDINSLDFVGAGTITTAGTFTLTPGGAVTLGDGGDTLTINTSDWDISTTGELTGISFDANGSGNSISNVDLTADITGTLPIANGGTGATSLTNLIALSTHTTGNYVTSVTNGTGITGGNGGSEGAALTLAFDYTSTLAGNPTLNAGETVFGTTGLIFEGSTANTFETLLTITDATADNTITLPDASGTVILSGHTFTGDVTGTLDTDGSTALTIAADSIALATDTTGNYVATITGNSQITVANSGTENAGVTLSIAADSIGDSQLAFNTGQHLTTTSSPTFTGLTLQNGESITNAVNGAIVFTENAGSQSITFDIDATNPTLATSTGGIEITLGSTAGDDFVVDGGTLLVEGNTNRVGIGTDSPTGKLSVESSGLTGGATALYGTTSTLGISTGTQSATAYGSQSTLLLSGDAVSSGGIGESPSGIVGLFAHQSTGTVAMGSGITGAFSPSGVGTFGTVTNAIGTGGFIIIGSDVTTGGTISNAYGLYAYSALNLGTGTTISNNYGLMVKDQTAGSSDYGVAIEGADTQALWIGSGADNTDAANGIAFGSSRDTNLYRSAANTLKTDDSLTIGGANLTFDSNGTITTGGTFNLTPGGAVTLGDGGDTLTINTSDWDISTTGELTGISFDANGSGNSISNIENADLANDTLDLDKIADTLSLDADLAFTAGAGEEITVNKTFTNNTGENGFVINFTGSDTGSGTSAQFGLYLDNSASTEGVDALMVLDNSDTDDVVGAAIKTIDAGGGFTNLFDINGTLITVSEFTVLDGGINIASEVSGVLPIANGGTNKNLTLSAGGLAYFDADSFEVLSAGVSGQVLTSGGTGAPTWVSQGAGGGLDADTLDAISSGSFLRSDTADAVTSGGITFNDDIALILGTGADVSLLWETADADAHYLSTVLSGTNNWIVSADANIDWGRAASTNPTLFVQSADQATTTDYISLFHDQTDGNIKTGGGDLILDPATGIVKGTSALTLQAGGSNQNLTLKSSGSGRIAILPGTNSTTAFQLQQADGTLVFNVDSTNKRIGILEASPDAPLHITNSITSNGANAIAGIKSELTFADTGGSSHFQYGNRTELSVTNATNAVTGVAEIVRVNDSTSLAHTIRGIEVQAFNGTNTAGVNTGVLAFGKTFGVQGVTTGLAGGVSEPAGVYAELQYTTTGNALRAYSDDITSASLVKFYQQDSTFTGEGLLMNFGKGTGSFGGKFVVLQNADTNKFSISSTGAATFEHADADNATSITIDTEESTSSQNIFELISDTTNNSQSADTTKAKMRADGSLFISLTGTQTTNALCHTSAGMANNDQIVDCSGAPSDLAENFGTNDASIEAGDVVIATGEASEYVGADGLFTTKAWIKKATVPYEKSVVGVISTQPNQLYAEDVFSPEENPRPVTLAGRVPVKVNLENGPIVTGDLLTSSSEPGVAMKATEAGMVLGQALQSFDAASGQQTIIAFIAPFYYNPNAQQEVLLDTETTGFLVNQNGSGNIMQLQNEGIDTFLVRNNGTIALNTTVVDPETKLFVIKNSDAEVFSINARGDLALGGLLIMQNDSFAGSVVTDEQGSAKIEFSNHVGTGKPVVQLTPEGDTPVFAQISLFERDNSDNYTGFTLQVRNSGGALQSGVTVHYLVIGKQDGYTTSGIENQTIVVASSAPVYQLGGSGGGSVAGDSDDASVNNDQTENEPPQDVLIEESTEPVSSPEPVAEDSSTPPASETNPAPVVEPTPTAEE